MHYIVYYGGICNFWQRQKNLHCACISSVILLIHSQSNYAIELKNVGVGIALWMESIWVQRSLLFLVGLSDYEILWVIAYHNRVQFLSTLNFVQLICLVFFTKNDRLYSQIIKTINYRTNQKKETVFLKNPKKSIPCQQNCVKWNKNVRWNKSWLWQVMNEKFFLQLFFKYGILTSFLLHTSKPNSLSL